MRAKRDYRTPLNIPAAKIGDFEIVHTKIPPHTPLHLNNARTAIFGQRGGTVQWDIETTWHSLLENGGRWMSDLPIEQKQHDDALKPMSKRVLVGGLGIGYAATVLAAKRNVKEIVVVEIQKEVIDLVAPHTKGVGGKVRIVHADLFDYLKSYDGEPFTWAFYDIWQSDGESTFFHTVVPLRELSRGKVKRVVCWNEDVMRGQLFLSLQNRLLFLRPDVAEHFKMSRPSIPPWENDGTDKPWHNWSVPFFKWWRASKPTEEQAVDNAQRYATIYGTPNWLKAWQFITLMSF